MYINVLAGSLRDYNTQAFLSPFIQYRSELENIGVKIKIYNRISQNLKECDTLFIDSKKFRKAWTKERIFTLEKIEMLASEKHKTLWFNTADSTGSIQEQVIDLVDLYYKGQLLRERDLYEKAYYGGRVYTDYYHRNYGVQDDSVLLSPALTKGQISKLRVSWNLGMNPLLMHWPVQKIHFIIHPKLLRLFKHPVDKKFVQKNTRSDKRLLINGRLGLSYNRKTIKYQRMFVSQELHRYGIDVSRLTQREYLEELVSSDFTVAPFGWGEVCIRDFEAVVAKSVLIKPDMSHMETWPDIYDKDRTYLSVPWELEKLKSRLEKILSSPNRYREVADYAADRYKNYVGSRGAEMFIAKIEEIIGDLSNLPGP